MDVRSAFNTGIAGFQDASAQLSNASSQIAQAGTAEKSMTDNQQPAEIISPSVVRTPISITTELINAKLAQLNAQNSAQVIHTADDMLGTLIDISV